MAKQHTFGGHRTSAIMIDHSNAKWILKKNLVLDQNATGVVDNNTLHNNKIEIYGKISDTASTGVAIFGDKTDVYVGKGAAIGGATGIGLFGDENTVESHGRVSSIIAFGHDNDIVNHGKTSGMIAFNSTNTLTNARDGHVNGSMYTSSATGEISTMVNHGVVVVSSGNALQASAGNDHVRNDGRVTGDIYLGAGNDTLNLLGGSVKGVIYGGDGEDVIVTSKANINYVELAGEGDDTVKATVSFTLPDNVEGLQLIGKANSRGTGNSGQNELTGNRGNNVLDGLGDADYLDGRGGNDRLKGGQGADVFHFQKGYDHDTITDFEIGVDKVEIKSGGKFADFNDMIDNFTHKSGQDVVISFGHDSLTIRNVKIGDLLDTDFIFMM